MVTDDEIYGIKEMRASGHTHQEIADSLGLKRSTVAYQLKKLKDEYKERLANKTMTEYPDGPDDERLMHLSKRELRLIVWAYGCELRGLKKDSTDHDTN